MQRSAVSAFTRVFDALCGALPVRVQLVETTGGCRTMEQRTTLHRVRDTVLVPLCGPGARAQSAVPGARSGSAGEVTEADGTLHATAQCHVDVAGIRDVARRCDQGVVGRDLAIIDADRDAGAAGAGCVLRSNLDIPGAVIGRRRSRR